MRDAAGLDLQDPSRLSGAALGDWARAKGCRPGTQGRVSFSYSAFVHIVPVGTDVREPDVSPQGEAPAHHAPIAVQEGKGHHLQGRPGRHRRGLGVPAERWGARSPMSLCWVGSQAHLPALALPWNNLVTPQGQAGSPSLATTPTPALPRRPAGMAAFPGCRVQVLRAPLHVDSGPAHLYMVPG